MIIVMCIDKKYMKLAAISIESYRKWNKYAWICVVSEDPMPPEIGYDENKIIKLPKKFRNRGEGDRITNTAYLKCFLTKLPYEKIIYVDADTICQKKLDDLWKIPCEYINACESHKYGEKQAKALGHEKYFLTGMMVMNLKKLRKIEFTEGCLDVEKNYPTPETGWQHDETCINVALGNKITSIDRKFNYCHNREYDHPIPETEAYILHYVGKDKGEMTKGDEYRSVGEVGAKITGKSVSIVGNAQTLFEKEYGEEIDGHDIVIRFNRGFIKEPKAQGEKTTILMLACILTNHEIKKYNARYVINRSTSYQNDTPYTIENKIRQKMKSYLGAQPSTGFMAVDMCLFFEAKSIDLYGFAGNKAPTFYNPDDYITQHAYDKEQEILKQYEKKGMIKIKP